MHIDLDEKGGVLLASEGCFAAWLPVHGEGRLEVTWNPDNYPALNVRTVAISDEALALHILTRLDGWSVHKLNLDVPWLADCVAQGVIAASVAGLAGMAERNGWTCETLMDRFGYTADDLDEPTIRAVIDNAKYEFDMAEIALTCSVKPPA